MNESDNITPSEPQSMTPLSPVLSSLPPPPVNSSLPPSPVYSAPPPLSPSPSSFHHNSLRSMSLSPSLLRNSPSDHVENTKPSLPLSGAKRRAGKDVEPLRKHYRSVSMDSGFTNLLTLPPSPSNVSSTSLVDGDDEYTADELKKISKCAKLTELAFDPKQVRGILKTRESATRSNQRKAQYVSDLEQRIKFLENQNTLMSEKIPLLEKDKKMMMDEKEKIKIRLDSLEQQAQLHDDEIKRLKGTTTSNEQLSVESQRLKELIASNEQLSVEIQRLKMETSEVMENNDQFDGSNMHQIDPTCSSDTPSTSSITPQKKT